MPVFHISERHNSTHVFQARSESSSEAAALHGKKALTPIIAGTISGTCIVVAWLIALIVALVKYRRRKRQYKKVGRVEKAIPTPEVFIIPPDPAVVEGQCQPGERIIVEKRRRLRKGRAKGKGKGKGKERVPFAVDGSGHAGIGEVAPNGFAGGEYPPYPIYLNRLSTIMSMDVLHQYPDGSPSAHELSNGNGHA